MITRSEDAWPYIYILRALTPLPRDLSPEELAKVQTYDFELRRLFEERMKDVFASYARAQSKAKGAKRSAPARRPSGRVSSDFRPAVLERVLGEEVKAPPSV